MAMVSRRVRAVVGIIEASDGGKGDVVLDQLATLTAFYRPPSSAGGGLFAPASESKRPPHVQAVVMFVRCGGPYSLVLLSTGGLWLHRFLAHVVIEGRLEV